MTALPGPAGRGPMPLTRNLDSPTTYRLNLDLGHWRELLALHHAADLPAPTGAAQQQRLPRDLTSGLMADMFDHTPQVWTAGQLRSALAAVPDETPVHVGVADRPGDFANGYDEFVVVHAEPVDQPESPGAVPQQVPFTLFADAAAGAYYLDVD